MKTSDRISLPDKDYLKSIFDYKNGTLIWKNKPNKKAYRLKLGSIAGTINSDGYIIIGINKKYYKAHRIIYKMFYNKEPLIIDHINGIPNDNRIENLQEITNSANTFKGAERSNNTSGFKGVYYFKAGKCWHASIGENSTNNHLGYFKNKKDAIKARIEAENSKIENYLLTENIQL